MRSLSFLRSSSFAKTVYKYCYIFLAVDLALICLVVYGWYTICDYNFCTVIPRKSRTNILAFGDSLTRGFVRSPSTYYPYSKSLEKTLNRLHSKDVNFVVDNAGINGDTALKNGQTRLTSSLRRKRYEWVVLLLGTNDLKDWNRGPGIDVNVLFNKLVELYKLALGGYRMVIVGTLTARQCEEDGFFETTCVNFGEKRQLLNERIRSYVANSTAMLLLADFDKELNYKTMDDKTRSKYWTDNVHLTESGYEAMAKLVYKKMQPYLPAMVGQPIVKKEKILLKGNN